MTASLPGSVTPIPSNSPQIPVRAAIAASPDYPFTPVDAPIKLDQNESSDDFPEALKAEVLQRVGAVAWNRYPDLHADALCVAIAQHDQWDSAGVIATTGSNVLISLLIQLSALQSRVLTVKPNFALYGLDARLLGSALTEVPLDANFQVDTEALLEALEDAPDQAPAEEPSAPNQPAGVIYLPRPHAPTGTLMAVEALEKIRTKAPNWLLVVDEAYHHFAPDDLRDWARQHQNVVILRTFSKAWGLAGMRLGYALTSAVIARQLRKLVPPFGVSTLQSITAQVALAHPEYVQRQVAQVLQERARVTAALQTHATWQVLPSSANFLLIRTPDAAAAYQGLLAQGVLVRRQDSYFGLHGCIRVTIGTPAENSAFLAAAAQLR